MGAAPWMARAELSVTGMTCASCAARIERRLNRLDGVSATVNYATERATVDFDPAIVRAEDLVKQVEAAGYGAVLPSPGSSRGEQGPGARGVGGLRGRLIGSAVLSVPVLVLAMVPALQFDRWAWVAGLLATPVVWWGGWGFHRAAWQNLRHATATMDTLISLGSISAWVWSVVALVLLGAGDRGVRMAMSLTAMSGTGGGKEFLGFPIPAAAGLVASLTLFLMWDENQDKGFASSHWRFILPIMMLFLSIMMVSEVKYPTFKSLNLKAKRTFAKTVLAVLFIGCLVILRNLILPVVLPVLLTLYLIYGFIRPRISRKMRHEIEEEEEEEEEGL